MVIQQNAFILPVESEPAMQDEDTALQKISERIRQFVNRIYYPCCGFDRRFESIFPQAAICYLDQNVENLKNLETLEYSSDKKCKRICLPTPI